MERNLVRRRWIYIVIFFCFLFLQQFDGLVVESIRYKVEEIFSSSGMISENLAFLLFLFVGLSYLLWGISFDRHSRRNLLVLAGAIWWATSWLSSLAPTAETFVISYLTGLMDFGSMTGIYSLVGDYFSPRNRGKIFGLLQSAQPIAYFLVLLYFQDLFVQVSWRSYLLVSGVLGLTLALVIYLFVREPKRGLREPALIGIRISGQYLFDWGNCQGYDWQTQFYLSLWDEPLFNYALDGVFTLDLRTIRCKPEPDRFIRLSNLFPNHCFINTGECSWWLFGRFSFSKEEAWQSHHEVFRVISGPHYQHFSIFNWKIRTIFSFGLWFRLRRSFLGWGGRLSSQCSLI